MGLGSYTILIPYILYPLIPYHTILTLPVYSNNAIISTSCYRSHKFGFCKHIYVINKTLTAPTLLTQLHSEFEGKLIINYRINIIYNDSRTLFSTWLPVFFWALWKGPKAPLRDAGHEDWKLPLNANRTLLRLDSSRSCARSFPITHFLFLSGGSEGPGLHVKQVCGNWREHQGYDERWEENPPAPLLPVSVFMSESQGWWDLSACTYVFSI